LITCAITFGWETSRDSRLQRVTGDVVKVENVFAGNGGDSKKFTIRYSMRGRDYYLVTRRGILDSLGALRGLQRGDRVPLAANPDPPHRAILDTLSGRYGITLCFVALAAIFFVAIVTAMATGRVSLS
jgi:hypothetical protein